MELGKYEDALQTFDRVLGKKPESREAWYRKGLVLIKLEHFEEAIKSFEKILEIDPALQGFILPDWAFLFLNLKILRKL